MNGRYRVFADGEGMEFASSTIHRFACCDCGLVHDFVIVSQDEKPVELALRRNNRATAQRRRRPHRARLVEEVAVESVRGAA